MSQLYARVFLQILDSSLAEDYQTRHVFEDILKLVNRDGVCDMTRQAISRRTNVPLEVVNDAIAKLESPDPHSRDPENEGRRLVRLDAHRDWGWRVVNWLRYDAIRTTVEHRQANAERQAGYRSKRRSDPSPAPPTQQNQPQKQIQIQEVAYMSPTCSLQVGDTSGTSPDTCGAAAPPCLKEVALPLPEPTPVKASPFKAIAAAASALSKAPPPLSSPTPTPKKPVVDRYEAAKAILEFLNTEAGRSFTPVPAHLNLIRDRIREALDDLEGIRTMIRRQVRMWSKTKMEEFLRPSTLFNRTKFSGYYDDRNQPLPPQDGPSSRQPAQKMHPDGRPRSVAMQLLREVEAEAGLVPGQY